MLRHVCAAGLAVMLVLTSAPAPAVAGERATLTITARVVDRCTVEVPQRIPPAVWRHRQHEPRQFVQHRCPGRLPVWIHARKVRLEHLIERLRAQLRDRLRAHLPDRLRAHPPDHDANLRERRHPNRRDVVLITITY